MLRGLVHRCAATSTFLCLLFFSHMVMLAQVAGGTISGTVMDPTGAVIPGAEVTIRNIATGLTRTLATNQTGFYAVANLNVGTYEIAVTAVGFRPEKETVTLAVGAETLANFSLRIGVSTAVEVEGTAPAVDLGSSSISSAIGGQSVRDLPLNGRDWTMLAALQPGVHTMDTQVEINVGQNARSNRGWGAQMSVAGNRPQQNNYRLDGITINDYAGGGPGGVMGMTLGVDAIQEFSVITGNPSAEYGRSSGGVINAVTRTGTNQFHGTAYEFLRNSALDARNYFDGEKAPPFKRNQFGLAVGGPIIKNNTFLFGDYEGFRQDLSVTNLVSVPSADAHVGLLCDAVPCSSKSQVTIDPNVQPYLKLFPLPNAGENGDVGIWKFVENNHVTEDLYTGRVDHTFSAKDSMHGTVMVDNSWTTQPDAYDFTRLKISAGRKLIALEESHIFSATLANFFRVGYSRSTSLSPDTVTAIDPRAADAALGFAPNATVGVIQISGLTTFQGGTKAQAAYDYHYNSFQLYNDLFLTRGNHSLKVGAALERIQSNMLGSTTTGFWAFGGIRSFITNDASSFSSAIEGANTPIYMRQSIVAGYVGDDWRAAPNLTLNLGVRYEMATVPTETNNHLATLTNISDSQPRIGSPYFSNPTLKNFSPRVGFSWDPFKDGKTAVRGGFGVYDTLPLTYQFELLALNTAPFFQTGNVTTGLQGTFPKEAYNLMTPDTMKVAFIQQNPGRMYVMQWNMNVQRDLGHSTTIQVGYNGSHGVHQPFRVNDANIVSPTGTANGQWYWPSPRGSGVRVNPYNGTIDTLVWNVSSIYDALTVHLKRDAKHLRTGVSFTWGKGIDTSSSSVAGANFSNSIVSPWLFFPQKFRGLSDFDIRHSLVANTMWDIPDSQWKGLAGRLVKGWQLGGIFKIADGLPFTPTIGGDPLGLRNNNPFGFPDRLTRPGCDNLVNPGNPSRYIKTECFAFPYPSTQLGNSGRNIATGPGIVDLDISMYKNNYIRSVSENFNVQFRAEMFNVLNHTNFRTPDRTSAQLFNQNGERLQNAGLLTATSTTSRQIQFAIRMIW